MVYVDQAIFSKGSKKNWCHMMADDLGELHAFAKILGLRASWFQDDHYDLSQSKRKLAVENGAIEVDSIFMVKLRKARRS